jgi:hypothetical protein
MQAKIIFWLYYRGLALSLFVRQQSNEFIWSDVCQEAFKKLKQAFISPEILAYPEDHGDFILDTDACDSSIGAVLSQIQNHYKS